MRADHGFLSVVTMITETLGAWADAHNKQLPQNILYYRDGVSGGHYSRVMNEEIAAIHSAYTARSKTAPKSKKLNLATVIVTQRHHTRFYPLVNADIDQYGNGNCRPGLCVDQLVSHPWAYCAHKDQTLTCYAHQPGHLTVLPRFPSAVLQRYQRHRPTNALLCPAKRHPQDDTGELA
jgi:hypothetical protein